jgi:hypothetical protein
VDERRAQRRWLRSESVSVQVLLPCGDGSCPAEVINTLTVDVSCNGMRLRVAEHLDSGRIFDICVEFRDQPRRFLLTGETRWCRRDPQHGEHEVGIAIHDGDGTDYAAWEAMFRNNSDPRT